MLHHCWCCDQTATPSACYSELHSCHDSDRARTSSPPAAAAVISARPPERLPAPLPLPLVERPSRIGTLWRPFWAPTWADGPAWTAGARRHAPGGGREAPRGRVLGAKAWGREGGVLAMYWEGSGYVLGRVWLRTRSDLSTYWEGLSFGCLILVSHRYISFVYPKELPQYTY